MEFHLLVRFTELKRAIRSTVALIDTDLPVLSADEWKIANELCKVLKPFETITNSVSGDKYCIASTVMPLVNGLRAVIIKVIDRCLC